MRKEDRGTVTGQLTEALKGYPNFYLTNTEALDAEKTSKLGRGYFKRGVKSIVAENNLLKKALGNIGGGFSDPSMALKGDAAVMFLQVANTPARLTRDFTKDAKGGIVVKPASKAAYVQENFYVGTENLEALINIKSKNELIVDIITLLESPAENVISALQSPGQTIHSLLKTLEEK